MVRKVLVLPVGKVNVAVVLVFFAMGPLTKLASLDPLTEPVVSRVGRLILSVVTIPSVRVRTKLTVMGSSKVTPVEVLLMV